IGIWGMLYTAIGVVPPEVDAYYFAFVNYTTLGYGDIIPVAYWRLLGPMAAMNGVLLFGWSAALIFDGLRTISMADPATQTASRSQGPIRRRRRRRDQRGLSSPYAGRKRGAGWDRRRSVGGEVKSRRVHFAARLHECR